MAAGNARCGNTTGGVASGTHKQTEPESLRLGNGDSMHDEDEDDNVLLFQDILNRQDVDDDTGPGPYKQGRPVVAPHYGATPGSKAGENNSIMGQHVLGIHNTANGNSKQATKHTDSSFSALLLKVGNSAHVLTPVNTCVTHT